MPVLLAYLLGGAAWHLMEPPGIQWGWIAAGSFLLGVLYGWYNEVRR